MNRPRALLMRADECHLLVVDVQEKLLPKMTDAAPVSENLGRLVAAARRLNVAMTFSEQYPKGLGSTVPVLAALLSEDERFEKTSFSCFRNGALSDRLRVVKQLVIAGLEAHVCVLQTALDAVAMAIPVFVVGDAVSSRVRESKSLAVDRLRQEGVRVVTTEMVLFEWLEAAGTDMFRDISKLVK